MGLFSRFERKMEDGIEGAAGRMSDAPITPVQISKRAEKAMKREKMVGAGREYAPTLYTVLVNPQDDQRLFGYYPTLAGETETYLAARATEQGLLMDGQPLVRFIVDNDLKRGKFDIIAEMVSAPIVEQLRNEELRRYGIGGNQQARYPQDYRQHEQPMPIPRPVPRPVPVQQPASQPEPQPVPGRLQAEWEVRGAHSPERPPQHTPSGQTPSSTPVSTGNPAPQPAADMPQAEGQPKPAQKKHELPYVPEDEIDRSLDYGEYTFNSQDFEDGRYDAPEPRRESRDVTEFSGTAAASDGGAVLVRLSDNKRQSLDMTIMSIGRETDNSIVVNDINTSRRHAELRYEDDGSWTIIDLNSTNGTKVNGRRVGSARLANGDRITIGVTDYIFMY